MTKLTTAIGAFAVACTLSASALAAPPWVDRRVTLPEHDWAFDFGLGLEHAPDPILGPRSAEAAAGINAQMAVSVVDRLELGVRTGVRFADEGKFGQPDYYGRLFDRQTIGGSSAGFDAFANPEFRVRGALVRTEVVDLALEGRVDLPLAYHSTTGLEFGMPLWFHIGNRVRLDTGVYVPIVIANQYYPSETFFSAPIDVWIQASPRVWFGPMSGLVMNTRTNVVDWSLGFGFGYQFTHALDFKAMLLMPDVNHNNTFGVGAGIQIRIE